MTRFVRSPNGVIRFRKFHRRLGVSQHSLYEWKKKFSSAPGGQVSDQSEEIRQLKRELARVTEERDILKKATAYFARDAK